MNHSKPRRWWLPGPPPPRRLISLDLVEESYRRDGTPELSVPVRSIRVPWVERSSVLAPYLDRSDKPGSAEETPVSGPKYLFHGCGNVLGPRVIQSFARRGPSIRFSRSQSYFSADQAVYWSNSVEFAIAWSFFSETGSWNLNDFDGKRPFRCLIFVSRLDLAEPSFEGGLYLIPRPQSPEEEAELGDAILEVVRRKQDKDGTDEAYSPSEITKGRLGSYRLPNSQGHDACPETAV